MKKVLLEVDFLNVAYRCFHAIRPLVNSKGQTVHAVHGFIQLVRRWMKEMEATHLAIVMDGERPQRRLELLPEYKAQRPPAPADLISQLTILTEIFPLMGWKVLYDLGEEADDLMASLALSAQKAGMEVRIGSNDKDLFQVVGGGIKIIRSSPQGSVCVDESWLKERWGIEKKQLVDFLALLGDSSDNIPGVPGVGEKTAAELLQKFGSWEQLESSLDQVTKNRIRENLKNHVETVNRNRRLIQLRLDCILPEIESFRLQAIESQRLLQRLAELELKSLSTLFQNSSGVKPPSQQGMLFAIDES